MIYSNGGDIRIEGDIPSILADFVVTMQYLIAQGCADRGLMQKMVDQFAYSPKEILKAKAKQEIIDEIDRVDNIGDALNLLGQVLSDRRLN